MEVELVSDFALMPFSDLTRLRKRARRPCCHRRPVGLILSFEKSPSANSFL
jgi:hypothetical protein